jgi:hypothetical protein
VIGRCGCACSVDGRTEVGVVNRVNGVLQGRLSQLGQGTLLDLSHTLGADPEDAGELTQRALRAIQAEAGAHDPQLASVETLQQHAQLRCLDALGHRLVGVLGDRIGKKVGESGSDIVAAHRLLEPAGLALGGDQPLYLFAA